MQSPKIFFFIFFVSYATAQQNIPQKNNFLTLPNEIYLLCLKQLYNPDNQRKISLTALQAVGNIKPLLQSCTLFSCFRPSLTGELIKDIAEKTNSTIPNIVKLINTKSARDWFDDECLKDRSLLTSQTTQDFFEQYLKQAYQTTSIETLAWLTRWGTPWTECKQSKEKDLQLLTTTLRYKKAHDTKTFLPRLIKNLENEELTPLFLQCTDQDSIDILRELDANINGFWYENHKYKDRKTKLAHYEAVKMRNIRLVTLLLAYPDTIVDMETPKGFSPLFRAIKNDDEDMTKCLLAHGADPNHHCRNTSPLHWAVIGPNPPHKIIKHLIAYGANPNVRIRYGLRCFYNIDKTPLEFAIKYRDIASVAVLLKSPLWDVNSVNKSILYDLLVWDRDQERYAIIDLLLKAGANIEIQLIQAVNNTNLSGVRKIVPYCSPEHIAHALDVAKQKKFSKTSWQKEENDEIKSFLKRRIWNNRFNSILGKIPYLGIQ